MSEERRESLKRLKESQQWDQEADQVEREGAAYQHKASEERRAKANKMGLLAADGWEGSPWTVMMGEGEGEGENEWEQEHEGDHSNVDQEPPVVIEDLEGMTVSFSLRFCSSVLRHCDS